MIATEEIGGSDCEALREGILAQPVNALSSLGYVVAGVVVWRRLGPQHRGWPGYTYALLLAAIGIGSALFHGPQPPLSKFLHDAPIALLLVLIAGIAAVRWRRNTTILPGWTRRRGWSLAIIGVLAGSGYFFGRTDSPVCEAESPAQPHGLWHLLTAVGFVIVADLLFRPTTQAVAA